MLNATTFNDNAVSEAPLQQWLAELSGLDSPVAELLSRPIAEQHELGYFHTLREICQQPLTWAETAERVIGMKDELAALCKPQKAMVLTGSGSSVFAAECLDGVLQTELGIPVRSVAGGELILFGGAAVTPSRPCLLVSFARSGDSPESCGAVDLLLATEPDVSHLAVTCNSQGHLATNYSGNPRVSAVVLDQATCDRSLVMTSSFTSMVVAARFLGLLDKPEVYSAIVKKLSGAAREILRKWTGELAAMARAPFQSAVFLGSGSRIGAARECALKMVESTSGRVITFYDSYLGLRHGPMCAVKADTLVVCYLSSDPVTRAYELDLIEELTRKKLGMSKLIVGEGIPAEVLQPGDVALDCAALAGVGDNNVPVIAVMVGQLLALFRSMAEGLKPDAPSLDGSITRVVGGFRIHGQTGGGKA